MELTSALGPAAALHLWKQLALSFLREVISQSGAPCSLACLLYPCLGAHTALYRISPPPPLAFHLGHSPTPTPPLFLGGTWKPQVLQTPSFLPKAGAKVRRLAPTQSMVGSTLG